MILKGYLFSVLYALACLLIAFVAYKLGASKKITRKIVHILVGFEWVILYHFMGAGIHFLAVCITFLLMLTIVHWKRLMPMISSDGDNAPGTVYYAVAMTVMAIITLFVEEMILPFGIGVFCTSIGDGFAGVVGQGISHRNPKICGNKTLYGTLTNFIVCVIVVAVMNSIFGLGLLWWHIISVAFFAVELELFTGHGLDNITVTLGSSLLSFAFINLDSINGYVLPILITPLVIAFSHTKNALTKGGIIAALILDVVISVSLGNFGFIILLAFFAFGVLVDKIKKRYDKIKQNIEKKGTKRDAVQVLANATVPAVSAALYFIFKEQIFVVSFVASLAEALADTAASGIGAFSRDTFDPFRMRKCEKGISGGMSLLGTLASILGATILSALALAFGRITLTESFIILAAGFLGGVFDSMLGSLLQVKYKCGVCGRILEREEHCGERTHKHSGLSFVTNDTVNLLGTLFSAVIAALIYNII